MGEVPLVTLVIPFDFTHSPDYCDFTRSYTVSVDGNPAPTWLTLNYAGNNTPPDIKVSTTDTSLEGIYSVTVQASVEVNGAVIYSNEPLSFTVTMSTLPCVETRLVDPGIPNIDFTIDSHTPLPGTVINWTEFVDSEVVVGGCGARLYALPDSSNPSFPSYITFNDGDKSISVYTEDWTDVGVYVLKFSAQQVDYPQWNPVSTKYVYITITIDSVCKSTTFYFTRVEMLHEIGKATPTTHTFVEPPDQVS